MLAPGAQVMLSVGPLGVLEGALGLPDLLEDVLNVGLQGVPRSLWRSDAAFSNSAAARAIASTSVASVGIRRSAAACRSWRVRASVSAIALSRATWVISTSSLVLASSAA